MLKHPFLRRTFPFSLVLGLFLATTATATDFTSSSFMVKDPVLYPAGYSTSSSYSLTSTIGQIAIGTTTVGAGSVRELRSGFEYFPFVSRAVVTATAGAAQVALSWSASAGILGFTVSGYSVGQSLVSGGPYVFAPTVVATASTVVGLTNGTIYYFVVDTLDAFGNVIATSTEVSATPVAGIVVTPPGPGGGGGGYTPPTIIPPSPPVLEIPPLTQLPPGFCHTIADLNCDGYVDIVDFSIMYYWFDKTTPPRRVDLHPDGRINIADFSVMAAYWYERPHL